MSSSMHSTRPHSMASTSGETTSETTRRGTGNHVGTSLLERPSPSTAVTGSCTTTGPTLPPTTAAMTARSNRTTAAPAAQLLPQSNLLLAGLDISVLLEATNHGNFIPGWEAAGGSGVGGRQHGDDDRLPIVPPRPQRLWKIQDTKLPTYPPLFPRPNRFQSCLIRDAPPSIIAVRIAECLRRRSCVVEYDEETCTATAVTADRCIFQIRLWRFVLGGSPSVSLSIPSGVLVECLRTTGSSHSYHWTVRAILQSAQSLDAGDDNRQWYQTSPDEYHRRALCLSSTGTVTSASTTIASAALSTIMQGGDIVSSNPRVIWLQAMDHARYLLGKDRMEAQRLGMELLVSLTDWHTSGIETSLYTALVVLGAVDEHGFFHDIHQRWIFRLLSKRLLPSEHDHDDNDGDGNDAPYSKIGSVAKAASRRQSSDLKYRHVRHHNNNSNYGANTGYHHNSTTEQEVQRGDDDDDQATRTASQQAMEDHHAALLRALAFVAVTNSLTVLEQQEGSKLDFLLHTHAPQWTESAFLQVLADDLHGANRPPTVVARTRLALAHEAVLAIRCLGFFAQHSLRAKREIVRNASTMRLLDGARSVGRSTHEILYQEASRVYALLTEEERSC